MLSSLRWNNKPWKNKHRCSLNIHVLKTGIIKKCSVQDIQTHTCISDFLNKKNENKNTFITNTADFICKSNQLSYLTKSYQQWNIYSKATFTNSLSTRDHLMISLAGVPITRRQWCWADLAIGLNLAAWRRRRFSLNTEVFKYSMNGDRQFLYHSMIPIQRNGKFQVLT